MSTWTSPQRWHFADYQLWNIQIICHQCILPKETQFCLYRQTAQLSICTIVQIESWAVWRYSSSLEMSNHLMPPIAQNNLVSIASNWDLSFMEIVNLKPIKKNRKLIGVKQTYTLVGSASLESHIFFQRDQNALPIMARLFEIFRIDTCMSIPSYGKLSAHSTSSSTTQDSRYARQCHSSSELSPSASSHAVKFSSLFLKDCKGWLENIIKFGQGSNIISKVVVCKGGLAKCFNINIITTKLSGFCPSWVVSFVCNVYQ